MSWFAVQIDLKNGLVSTFFIAALRRDETNNLSPACTDRGTVCVQQNQGSAAGTASPDVRTPFMAAQIVILASTGSGLTGLAIWVVYSHCG